MSAKCKNPKPTLHNNLIAEICDQHGAQRSGFNAAMKKRLEVMRETEQRGRIVPDAYLIDSANFTIKAWEVEVSHHLSREKQALYFDLYEMLGSVDWELVVIHVNRFGGETELNPGIAFFQAFYAECPRSRHESDTFACRPRACQTRV